MDNIDSLVETVRRLPKAEQERFLARLSELGMVPDGKKTKRGWTELLALGGSVNRGKVLVPFPDSEMLYGDRF